MRNVQVGHPVVQFLASLYSPSDNIPHMEHPRTYYFSLVLYMRKKKRKLHCNANKITHTLFSKKVNL